jgi:hypothetical protein
VNSKDEGGWKVYDIAIEGVSILSSSHSQIGRLVQRFGYSGMLAMLKKQNRLMIEENERATKVSAAWTRTRSRSATRQLDHFELRGPSYRTRHMKLDLNQEPEPIARISRNQLPEFPEPTSFSRDRRLKAACASASSVPARSLSSSGWPCSCAFPARRGNSLSARHCSTFWRCSCSQGPNAALRSHRKDSSSATWFPPSAHHSIPRAPELQIPPSSLSPVLEVDGAPASLNRVGV